MIARNGTLDILKLIASYAVVLIHVSLGGAVGNAVNGMARFAVPLFFAISGFYSYGITRAQARSRTFKILRLALFTTLLYTAVDIIDAAFSDGLAGVGNYLLTWVNPSELLQLIFFNRPITSVHLWYLYALAYVYAIYCFLLRRGISLKRLTTVAAICLGVGLIFSEGLSFCGILLERMIYRNFLFMGLPFFTVGLLAAKHRDRITTIPKYVIILIIAVGAVESALSALLFELSEIYIGSLMILGGLIAFFIKQEERRYPKYLTTIAQASKYVYILHLLISEKLYVLYSLLPEWLPQALFNTLHPFTVCAVSTAVGYLAVTVERSCKKRKAIN